MREYMQLPSAIINPYQSGFTTLSATITSYPCASWDPVDDHGTSEASASANAVTVAAVQQRLGQVREDLVQPIREATGAQETVQGMAGHEPWEIYSDNDSHKDNKSSKNHQQQLTLPSNNPCCNDVTYVTLMDDNGPRYQLRCQSIGFDKHGPVHPWTNQRDVQNNAYWWLEALHFNIEPIKIGSLQLNGK